MKMIVSCSPTWQKREWGVFFYAVITFAINLQLSATSRLNPFTSLKPTSDELQSTMTNTDSCQQGSLQLRSGQVFFWNKFEILGQITKFLY